MLENSLKETESLRVDEGQHQDMVAERELGREEVKLMEEQVKLRVHSLEKLGVLEKEIEEALNRVADYSSQLMGAAELKNIAQTAKRELKKSQALLSESLSQFEASQQHLTHLRAERNQREQRARQYQDHYHQMNDELAAQIEAAKIDKAERLMVLQGTASEQVAIAKENMAALQKEVQALAREGGIQVAEGVRRMVQIEEYVQGVIERVKNGFVGIPEIRLG